MFFCSSVAASTSLFVIIPSFNEAKGFVVCLQTFTTRIKTDCQKSLGSYGVTINQSNSKFFFLAESLDLTHR